MDPTQATDDTIMISKHKAETICRMGQGAKCCAFLAVGGLGLECLRGHKQALGTIMDRLREGSMVAQARGGWQGCYWRGQIPDDDHRNVDPSTMLRDLQQKYDRVRGAAIALVGVNTREELAAMADSLQEISKIVPADSDLPKTLALIEALIDTVE